MFIVFLLNRISKKFNNKKKGNKIKVLNLKLNFTSEVIEKLVWQHSQIPEFKKEFMAENVLQEFLTWEKEKEKEKPTKKSVGGACVKRKIR